MQEIYSTIPLTGIDFLGKAIELAYKQEERAIEDLTTTEIAGKYGPHLAIVASGYKR